ncbi:MAG: dihydrolipoamide acetyltransferase family protein [Pseudomonadota bacterium]
MIASATHTFHLPDLGEGLEDAEIVAWHVCEGDHVVADQPLVSVETDKAVVEVPAPLSGRITRLHGTKGDVVKVGAPLVELEATPRDDAGTVVGKLARAEAETEEALSPPTRTQTSAIRATPAVRALAHTLEVDLAGIAASGPDGTITRADVERAARSMEGRGEPADVRGMRRAMARRMEKAHAEVVPAGVMDEADIGEWQSSEDISIRVIRAIAAACRAVPALNAHYDRGTGTRSLLERIDLGIAVDTEDGLIVPVMRNVGMREASDLRAGLDRLRRDARARIVPPEELRGATITLSNFGMLGGRFAHLVVVPPQVAIVGVGRSSEQVLPVGGVPAVRRTLPLTLMFDHRIVTGGEGARFMAALKADLEKSR